MNTEYRLAEYHSHEWGCLVEQGFVTMFVENGCARMIRQTRRRIEYLWR